MVLSAEASLVAVLGGLAVAVVVLARRQGGPESPPMLALCVGLVVWHLGDFLLATTRTHQWQILSAFGSVALVPPLVHFVLAALRRRRTWSLTALYVFAGVVAAGTAVGFVHPGVREIVVSPWFALFYLVLLVPPIVAAIARAAIAARRATDLDIRARARGIIAGLGIALPAGLFDLAALAIPDVPMIGSVGTIAGIICFAWTLDVGVDAAKALPTRSVLLVVAVTTGAAFLTVAISKMAAGGPVAVIAAGGGATLAAIALFRIGSARLQRDAERMQSLALLGTFAAEVAHEVRNPLAAIRGAVQLLAKKVERGADPSTYQEYLSLIDAEVERLDGVVTDYHSLARRTSQRTERGSVARLVRDLVALHAPVIPREVEVRTDLRDDLPPVRMDPARLRQALLNLIRNAVAAMPSGGTLTLRASARGGGPNDSAILLEVEDTGTGIPQAELRRIFEPLYTNREGGSGLGLAVAQRIAHEHGGELRVRSDVGKGSTFTFVLPTEER